MVGVEVFLGSRSRKIMLARVESRSRTEKKSGVGVGVEVKKYLRVKVVSILLRLVNLDFECFTKYVAFCSHGFDFAWANKA